MGSSPTRPTASNLQWNGYRQVVTSLFHPDVETLWKHPCGSCRFPRVPHQCRGLLGGGQVGLLQWVGVAVVDRPVGVAVVAEGGGDGDARWIDLTVDARFGPGEGTVLQEPEVLVGLRLVIRDDSRSGVGGRWMVTDAARPYIR